MEIKEAKDLVKDNDLAVVVFTKGTDFYYDAIGSGETGNWVVDPEVLENVNRVIIYLRDEKDKLNRIFLGNYAGCRKSPIANRHIIRFSKLTEVGITNSNWKDFANSGQNPVSYVGNFY